MIFAFLWIQRRFDRFLVFLACLTSRGFQIVSGHFDGKLRLWDIRTGSMTVEIADIHSSKITGVAIFPDGFKALTNSRDHSMRVVDIRTNKPLCTLMHADYRNGLDWNRPCVSPDGNFVAVGMCCTPSIRTCTTSGAHLRMICL